MVIKTKIIKINPKNPEFQIIKNIVEELKKGKIIIYPTETCYGFGADALNKKAVMKIYKVKREPKKSNIIVIVDSIKTAERFGFIDNRVKKIVKNFMPGPLTLIVKRKKVFPKITNKDFAFRISSNKIASMIVKKLKKPLTATSANIHGNPSIYSAKEAIEMFYGKVDIIIDAGRLKKIKPSTIIDVKNEVPKLIREGPIPFEKFLRLQ